MSRDERQIERERDVYAEASALLKRVRKGELDDGRLLLAAQLGYEPAAAALGPEAPEEVRDLKRWVKRIDAHGPDVAARIIVACGRLLLPILEELPLVYGPARDAVEAGEAFLRCPCDDHAGLARGAYTKAIAAAVRCPDDRTETAALVAAFAAHGVNEPTPATDIAADSADAASEDGVRRTIVRALLPWALE